IERLLPRTLNEAIAVAVSEHPAITGAIHNMDVAEYTLKIAESALLPTVAVTGNVMNANDFQGVPRAKEFTASVVAQLTVPLYDGGASYASIRQGKEQFGQARLQVDVAREQIRAALVSAWGQWQSARGAIIAQEAAVRAAGIALTGTREEALVG